MLTGTVIQPAAAASGVTYNWDLPLPSGSYSYSSQFGPRCIPVLLGSTNHLGQDLAAAPNTPILAAAGGTVIKTQNGTDDVSGVILIEHSIGGKKYTSAYYHMWDARTHVWVGDTVEAGEIIGLVGTSGPSTADHLHFEMWDGGWYTGTAINPVDFLRSKGVFLKANAKVVWNFPTPSSCTYYAGTALNLRSQASLTSSLLASLPAGTVMTSTPGIKVNGYVPVTVAGVSGWVLATGVSEQYVAPPAPPAPDRDLPTYRTLTTTVNADVRAGASEQSGSYGVLPKGTAATVYGHYGDWTEVAANGLRGWVYNNYLAGGTWDSGTRHTAWLVNIHAGASTNTRSYGLVDGGTPVTIYGHWGGWTEVWANGLRGWVMTNSLR